MYTTGARRRSQVDRVERLETVSDPLNGRRPGGGFTFSPGGRLGGGSPSASESTCSRLQSDLGPSSYRVVLEATWNLCPLNTSKTTSERLEVVRIRAVPNALEAFVEPTHP
ncbi:hypothetical protein Pst134EB_004182 [Puccinia striiformis f. sp. tritici]|nr:hypothetical protein Pst134EB_004182 [Puccinia striiformis f. sp. tritici]